MDDRQVTQLLSDIVYFVAYQENAGRDPFTVQLTHSDRERPKLLREQNVLKQVGFVQFVYFFISILLAFSALMLSVGHWEVHLAPSHTINLCFILSASWGTGIRGLRRGMATLPQGNQQLSVVKDKAGRPQVSLG